MNKILIAASIACATLGSCHRTPTCSNTVTITDGNTDFLHCSEPSDEVASINATTKPSVTVALSRSKPGAAAEYMVSVYSANSSQFVLDVVCAYAPSRGAGSYELLPQDSARNYYMECINFKSYKIASGTVNITAASGSNVTGTFVLNVFNASEQRTITGTINANKPTINY